MRDRPGGAALLTEARRLLLEALLPLLPAERQYEARMVANAMAIAARELAAGDAPLREAWRALAPICGAAAEPMPAGTALEERLIELERRLAEDIRSGRFDADGQDRRAMHDYLRMSTAARLRLSNPKALPPMPKPSSEDGGEAG